MEGIGGHGTFLRLGCGARYQGLVTSLHKPRVGYRLAVSDLQVAFSGAPAGPEFGDSECCELRGAKLGRAPGCCLSWQAAAYPGDGSLQPPGRVV